MRSLVVLALATVLATGWTGVPSLGGEPKAWPKDWPVYRHIVIVMEENKDYDQIIGNPAAPYLNQGVGFLDKTPGEFIHAPSLGGQLLAASSPEAPTKHMSFKGFAEDLAEPGTSREAARTAKAVENPIPTLIAGAHVKQGDYEEGRGVTHVNLLRTLEAMYGLPRIGAQQVKAVKFGIDDRYIWDLFGKAR